MTQAANYLLMRKNGDSLSFETKLNNNTTH